MNRLAVLIICIRIALLCFWVVGWVLNIYQIIKFNYALGYLLVKVIGIVIAPIGIILGYVGLF